MIFETKIPVLTKEIHHESNPNFHKEYEIDVTDAYLSDSARILLLYLANAFIEDIH